MDISRITGTKKPPNVFTSVYAKLGLACGAELPNRFDGAALLYLNCRKRKLCGECASRYQEPQPIVDVEVFDVGEPVHCFHCIKFITP